MLKKFRFLSIGIIMILVYIGSDNLLFYTQYGIAESTKSEQIEDTVDESLNDIVWTEQGTGSTLQNRALYGRIELRSPTEIQIRDSEGIHSLSSRQISAVQYSGEPIELITGRILYRSSEYQLARKKIGEIAKEVVKEQTKKVIEEMDYLLALASARLVLEQRRTNSKEQNMSDLKEEIQKAALFLKDFLKEYPQSWHRAEVAEVARDIFLLEKNLKGALECSNILASMPWSDIKAKGLYTKGQILREMGNTGEAIEAFHQIRSDSVSLSAEKENVVNQVVRRLKINSGRELAEILNESEHFEEAVRLYQQILQEYQKAVSADNKESNNKDDEEIVLLGARLYNGLGCALVKAGRRKEAIHAFLHVDLLYSDCREENRKALGHLEILWKEEGYPNRAMEIQKRLKQ